MSGHIQGGCNIGTSDASLVPTVLGCLDAAGVEYAILHGSDRVLANAVESDLDVVVGAPPIEVMRRAQRRFADAGLVPIMEWPYDVAGTRTVFLATEDGERAVQLDMLYDRAGIGKYAVRSDAILERAQTRDGQRVLDPVDELVYLVRKRTVKGDADALAALSIRAREIPRGRLLDSINSNLSYAGRRSVRPFLDGASPDRPRRPFKALLDAIRHVRRVFSPTGFWVHVSTPEQARLLSDRFRVYLPHVTEGDPTTPTGFVRLLVSRMRPGLVITTGRRTRLVSPDVFVAPGFGADVSGLVVAAMRSRTETRLGLA